MVTLPTLLSYTLLLFHSVLSQEDIVCLEDEQCVILFNCKTLLPLLHTARETLKEYHCGWHGRLPKVCCPFQEPSVNSVPTSNILNMLQPVTQEPKWTTATSVNDGIRNPFSDDYDDVSHENLQNIDDEEESSEANIDTDIVSNEDDDKHCVSLSICKELHPLVKTARELLKEYHCGWDGTMPKVNCPSRKLPVNIFTPLNFGIPSQPETQEPLMRRLLRTPVDNHGKQVIPELIPKFNNKPQKIVDCGYSPGSNRILNGNNVAVDEYPWLALLEYVTGYLGCAGSVISPKFILTAAHCFDGIYGKPLLVRLAEYNTSSFPTDYVEVEGGGFENITVQIVSVKTTYSHPKYNRRLAIHDIGLIQMAEAVDLHGDFIKKICLPFENYVPEFTSNTNLTVAGWGSIDNVIYSDVKLQVDVPFVPWESCEKVQDESVMNTQICAGGLEGKDSCKGDSGGPLMYAVEDIYYVVGIVSYGPSRCGTKGRPATHTNVYYYMSWILDVMARTIK